MHVTHEKNTSDGPVLDGATDATPEQKIRGLLDQLAADVSRFPDIDAVAVVKDWIRDAGVEPNDAQIQLIVTGFRQRGLSLPKEASETDKGAL